MTADSSAAPPRFGEALSTNADSRSALEDVCTRACEQLEVTPDLAVVFVSHHHAGIAKTLSKEIRQRTSARVVIGCTGEAIIGEGKEVEQQPAISLWLASLPGMTVDPMHLEFAQTEDGVTFAGWPDNLPEPWPEGAVLIVLAEPFSFPADELVERLNEDRPGIPVVGGMASGANEPGRNRVYLNDQGYNEGAVAVLLHGSLNVRTVVSQGCRPIGRHFVITKSQDNVILELSGVPAMTQLQEVFQELSPEDQELAQHGLHVGRVINEYQEGFSRGDFLVRNVIGVDTESGAMAIGDFVRTGQTVQFHVRDAKTAGEDMGELLTLATAEASAALLFTCNGRGTRLFEEPDHDVGVLRTFYGDIPVGGFFAQGELGPVGGANFLHGFTASILLFEPPPE
ncbi:FIST N domain protein [Planctomycetes bacterium Pan216]|uniref:FIST N domain protein n=1 Tax=Kolteria novifilia TaxID=2527975 RepID=A0A518B3U8_9BACT|nr:FIST N domain protein [Planctomycetes bacterium Pan216]